MNDLEAFAGYLQSFAAGLPEVSLAEWIDGAGGPRRVAFLAVDILRGFCSQGPLASERVGGIAAPTAALWTKAWALGCREFAHVMDHHDPHAVEFEAFAPHCRMGTAEAEEVPELATLPFADHVHRFHKNSTSSWFGTEPFLKWLSVMDRGGVKAFVVSGDCTDLCVYQLAVPLKLRANAENRPLEVVVPVDTVDTYDLPVKAAEKLGIMPHPGDLLHRVFLYHMALNGVRVIRRFMA